MATTLEDTLDPGLRSWVKSANDPASDFPIQNLPFGRFRREEGMDWRIGVAIGDQILDLLRARLIDSYDMNRLMACGREVREALRIAISDGLREGSAHRDGWLERDALVPMQTAELSLPCRIGDYTDFYTGIHHATTVGKLFRPDNPLMPNYKWVPIGYHGRASSIGVSGQRFRRPCGQTMSPDSQQPAAGCRPHAAPRLRTGTGRRHRYAQRQRRTDRYRTGRGAPVRLYPAKRLERARHPGMGIPAAWTFPVEEFCDDDFALDGDAGSLVAVSCPVRAAGWRSDAAGLHGLTAEPDSGRPQHHARSLAAHRKDAGSGPAGRTSDVVQLPPCLLDGGADDRAPHRQWVQSVQRRPARHWHLVRPAAGAGRLAARVERGRQTHPDAVEGRAANLAGRRRYRHPARLLRTRRLPPHRLWFAALLLRPRLHALVEPGGTELLRHLSLLFVPAGVGIVAAGSQIGGQWPALVAALVGGTLITLALTAAVVRALDRRTGTPDA